MAENQNDDKTQTYIVLTKGTMVSHYRIIEKIGAGGMGEVYLADDTELDRKVALKFLPPHLCQDEDCRRRFKREAQAAAKLDHPNIVTIHEVSEYQGRPYFAMQHVEGQSLREYAKAREVPIDKVINLAIQICDGLGAAHEKKVIHRDIKPSNIVIDAYGRPKILDFGLAAVQGGEQLTRTGSTLGTVGYMSPEQAKGEVVDHRTDIWSLGVVLYEMLTGRLPFKRDHEQATIYAILNEEPEPLGSFRSGIPPRLEHIVHRALEKDRGRRYKNMQELLQDLQALTVSPAAAPKQEKSLVVLPFENMSPDPDQEYFSDGLTEEIITDLSNIRALRVISRTSSMRLKGTDKDVRTIGRELNVRYVMEGSVRKAQDNLRITAQLIDARDDSHIWAEKYSGTLDDVFDIQEKVSRSIVDALKIKLSTEENKKIAEHPIENVHAYECHLRAIYNIWLTTEEGLERALQFINSGLEIIGKNEILYADKGQVYIHYVDFVVGKDESYLTRADECVKAIFELNPDSAHGHFLNGLISRNRGNAQKAVQELKKAIQIYPEDPNFLLWLIWVYGHSGQGSAARPLSSKLLEIDPLSPVSHMGGIVDLFEGKFDIAKKSLYKCHRLEKGNPFYRYWYAKALAYNLSIEEALEMFELIDKETPNTIWSQLSVFFSNALQKKKVEALQSVTEEVKKMFQNDEMFPIWMAESYSLIDEKEEAIKWLEHGIDWGFINFWFLNEYDPFLENIRGEERFRLLMKRVKREWEDFEV